MNKLLEIKKDFEEAFEKAMGFHEKGLVNAAICGLMEGIFEGYVVHCLAFVIGLPILALIGFIKK